MAFGKRIKLFRTRKGLLQKQLGELLGFMGKTSDVRIAQYENEARTPKDDLIKEMAQIFDVSPRAITVPDIDSYVGLAHTFFTLEDMYGLKIGELDGELCLRLDKNSKEYLRILEFFQSWQTMADKITSGEITQEEYDEWRYKYPELDTSHRWAKVPSQEFSDFLTDALKDETK